jgi:hypothetical protein
VTIHAYSPPLWRMGAYVIEPGGALRRESLSYAEELRPLLSSAREDEPLEQLVEHLCGVFADSGVHL